MMTDSRADGTIPGRSETLFGRGEELAWLRGLAVAGASELICVLGSGGLGKTRLLEAFGELVLAEGLPCGPVIDYYHVDSFRASAIEEAILDTLGRSAPEHKPLLEPYFAARGRLERSRTSGSEFRQAQREIRAVFVECYNALAERAVAAGVRVVLLFDTVEQAVGLSDRTEERLDSGAANASAGGDQWLRAVLPQLKNTLAVLGGRPETLYGVPVGLYDELSALIPCRTLALKGLDEEATAALARDMLARSLASADEQTAGIAITIDLDDAAKLRAWYQLSEGLPFWIAILFTLEFVGGEPKGVLSQLQDTVGALGVDEALSREQREDFRASLRDYFLGEVSQVAPPIQVALQCMATIRKGLTPELLDLVLARLGIVERPTELFALLRSLAVVKARRARRYTSRGARPGDPADHETLLFLHDELYAWLDGHPFVSVESRQVVRDVVFDWYLGAIKQAQAERLAAAEALRFLREGDPATKAYEVERDDALRRKRKLERDLLNYAFEGADQGGEEAVAHYQILAYEAVFDRVAGQEAALHQEVLRSIYRHAGKPGPADELAFGAIALLRAAVQYEDMAQTRRLLGRLDSYTELRGQASGLALAFFELATAIARLYSGEATQAEECQRIEQTLERVEVLVKEAEAIGAPTPARRRWLIMLRAQALNFRGYLHRRNYELAAAIRAYRRSNAVVVRSEPGLLPQFRATTLNNLAYALSEQGETEEAQRIALEALAIRQRYGTAYNVAYSRNVLARIALRAGEAARARQFAEAAAARMREVGGPRGMLLSLPVLADAYRKEGELLDDSPGQQDAAFEQALAVLDEAEAELVKLEAPLGDVQREIMQTRGCTYRSWGQARRRRGPGHYAAARQNLSVGHGWLEQTLEVARANGDSPIVLIDILEDLAAVHVYEDEYDHRLYEHLDEAEALAETRYKVLEGVGAPEVADATRAYWKELGQCQLQRMLGAFGKLEFGLYEFETTSGRRRRIGESGDLRFLDEAAEHLVITMAYLCRYRRHSWMLHKARDLTLRELLQGRTLAVIDRFQLAAYEAARRYGLLYDESFRVVEHVIGLARDNLDLDG